MNWSVYIALIRSSRSTRNMPVTDGLSGCQNRSRRRSSVEGITGDQSTPGRATRLGRSWPCAVVDEARREEALDLALEVALGSVRRLLDDPPRLALHDLAQLLGVLGELRVAEQAADGALAAGDPLGELAGGREQRVDLGQ